MNLKSLLPHNYRTITAGLHATRKNALLLTILFQILVCLFTGTVLFFLLSSYMDIKQERVEAIKKLETWEKTLKKHPTYPQAYYEAAFYAAILGNTEKANTYLNKALSLRENYEAAKQLQIEIRKR